MSVGGASSELPVDTTPDLHPLAAHRLGHAAAAVVPPPYSVNPGMGMRRSWFLNAGEAGRAPVPVDASRRHLLRRGRSI